MSDFKEPESAIRVIVAPPGETLDDSIYFKVFWDQHWFDWGYVYREPAGNMGFQLLCQRRRLEGRAQVKAIAAITEIATKLMTPVSEDSPFTHFDQCMVEAAHIKTISPTHADLNVECFSD